MSRRLGYGRAVSEAAAQQITARLRLAGCVNVVIDRGTGTDPQPEWHKLHAARRPTDTPVIATLPAEGKHCRQGMIDLQHLDTNGTCTVEILAGARLSHPQLPDFGQAPDPTTRQLSAGQLYRYRRPIPKSRLDPEN